MLVASLKEYLALLKGAGVTLLADVRRSKTVIAGYLPWHRQRVFEIWKTGGAS